MNKSIFVTNSSGISSFQVFLGVIFLDQMSKFIAQKIGLQIAYNSGISLSFLSNADPIFLTIALCILVYILYNNFKLIWLRQPVATGLFFGGAVANIFDRVLFGGVRDWFTIPFTDVQNNIADWAIFLGLFLLMLRFTKDSKSIIKNK